MSSRTQDYTALNDWMIMNNEVKSVWKKMLMEKLNHYPDICLEGLTKITKTLSQDSQCPKWDLNLEILEYKSEMLSLEPAFLVTFWYYMQIWSSCIVWVKMILQHTWFNVEIPHFETQQHTDQIFWQISLWFLFSSSKQMLGKYQITSSYILSFIIFLLFLIQWYITSDVAHCH